MAERASRGEIVVHDRGGASAEGARAGAPQALQVADRFTYCRTQPRRWREVGEYELSWGLRLPALR
jgi:hypothetical protein